MQENGYLISLDMGTSSIGYCVFDLDNDSQPFNLIDMGVRIFNDGREPKSKEPLAVTRRAARGTRRNRDRSQNRIRRLVSELIHFGLLPEDNQKRQQIFRTLCPYECRAKAAEGPISTEELGRAIFHIGRRRGFKSNRLSQNDQETEFKQKITALQDKLGGKTLGQFLYEKNQNNKELVSLGKLKDQQTIRFKAGTEIYSDRQMYKTEFDIIRKQQQAHHALTDKQWDDLFATCFWQYPLKPVPKGKCRFFPEHSRANSALPISHEFRINQEINNLRYNINGETYNLDGRQRQVIRDALMSTKTSKSFTSLLKLKDEHKSPLFPVDAEFNLHTETRKGLNGNTTLCELKDPNLLGKVCDSLDSITINDIVEFLIQLLKTQGNKEILMESDEIDAWLRRKLPQLDEENIKNLRQHNFSSGTMSVSRKFMEKIVPILQDTGMVYSEAVQYISNDDGVSLHHSHFERPQYKKLPYYGEALPESVWGEQPESDQNKSPNERDNDAYIFGKIANPTVHIALNQLRKVVNSIIDKQNGILPTKIHIELSRDLKNSKNSKIKIERQIHKNKKNKERIKAFLIDEFRQHNPSRADIQKIILWEELGKLGARTCVFTGQTIGAQLLFSGDVEVEHIIPFSRCYDDSMMNKTLAFKSANQIKGNKTPAEAWSSNDYTAILTRARAAFGKTPKYRRFLEDAYNEFYGEGQGDFLARQLNDNRYLSRKAKQYLECICPAEKITTVNGQMTALLRDVWQINHFKNKEQGHYRDDHRHHIVDAFVVGLTNRSLVQKLSTRSSRINENIHKENTLYNFLKEKAPPIDALKQQLFSQLDQVIVSHKQDHNQQGSLFNDTAYGLGKSDNGENVGITKKAVNSLSFKEVFQVRSTSYRKKLINFLMQGQTLDSNALKITELKKQLKKVVGNEKRLAEQLEKFAKQHKIKNLRLSITNDSITKIKSAPYKGYALGAYAYCDIWQIPTKQDPESGRIDYRYEGIFISYAEIPKYQQQPKRPRSKDGREIPTAKKLMRLYKQDCILLKNEQDGTSVIKRVAGYNTSQNKLDLRDSYQAETNNRQFTSINKIFNNYHVHKLKP